VTGRIANANRIRQDYFQWLCEIVRVNNNNTSYWILLRELHSREFIWTVANDDNRAKDGCDLRDEYIHYKRYEDCRCLDGPCSVLEMLIALARRIDF
jgi:hypothetical protein